MRFTRQTSSNHWTRAKENRGRTRRKSRVRRSRPSSWSVSHAYTPAVRRIRIVDPKGVSLALTSASKDHLAHVPSTIHRFVRSIALSSRVASNKRSVLKSKPAVTIPQSFKRQSKKIAHMIDSFKSWMWKIEASKPIWVTFGSFSSLEPTKTTTLWPRWAQSQYLHSLTNRECALRTWSMWMSSPSLQRMSIDKS